MQILQVPHPALLTKAQLVSPQEIAEARAVASHMLQLMQASLGIGLAAPQIGISKRVIVVGMPGAQPEVFINPEITAQMGDLPSKEGCLSVPGELITVRRSTLVAFEALNINGDKVRKIVTGLEACCVQHEIDHLDGITLIQRRITHPAN